MESQKQDQMKIRVIERKIKLVEGITKCRRGFNSLDAGLNQRLSLISEQQESWTGSHLRRVLAVNHSSYRYWREPSKRTPTERRKRNISPYLIP